MGDGVVPRSVLFVAISVSGVSDSYSLDDCFCLEVIRFLLGTFFTGVEAERFLVSCLVCFCLFSLCSFLVQQKRNKNKKYIQKTTTQ